MWFGVIWRCIPVMWGDREVDLDDVGVIWGSMWVIRGDLEVDHLRRRHAQQWRSCGHGSFPRGISLTWGGPFRGRCGGGDPAVGKVASLLEE